MRKSLIGLLATGALSLSGCSNEKPGEMLKVVRTVNAHEIHYSVDGYPEKGSYSLFVDKDEAYKDKTFFPKRELDYVTVHSPYVFEGSNSTRAMVLDKDHKPELFRSYQSKFEEILDAERKACSSSFEIKK